MSDQKPKYVTFRDLHSVSSKNTDVRLPKAPVSHLLSSNPNVTLETEKKDFSEDKDIASYTSTSSSSSISENEGSGVQTPPPANSVNLNNTSTYNNRQNAKALKNPSYTSTPSSTSITRAKLSDLQSQLISLDDEESRQKDSIAPERDFQRVPNSVVRNALPQGIFRGKSKQVWDYLWSVSRGSIIPTRQVRRSRKEILKGSGLGSMVTVDSAVGHLQAVGLIKVEAAIGSLHGNLYEVFTPEEINPRYTSTTSTSRYTSPTQNLVHLDVLDSSISSTTQVIENKDTSVVPKTSFKTNTNDDDETLTTFLKTIREAHQKIAGKKIQPQDKDKWNDVAAVIAAELERAAAKTDAISSVPAFLAEHLRRRLNQPEPKAENTAPRKNRPERGAIEKSTSQPAPARKISAEEKFEAVRMVVDLVASGNYTLEQAETQFAASFGAEQWSEIKNQIEQARSAKE